MSVTINNTPVRTSENYNINNIKIPDLKKDICENFKNVFLQNLDVESIVISNDTSKIQLTYGNGKQVEEQVIDSCNCKLKMQVNKNTTKENIIHFIFDEESNALVDDVEIEVQENCSASVTLRYASTIIDTQECMALNGDKLELKSTNYKAGYHNGIIRTRLGNNSKLKLTVINLLGEDATNMISMDNQLEESSELDYCIVDFGGNSSVTNYYTNLKGNDSKNELNTIYLESDNKLIDINDIVETRGERTNVKIDVQGALNDNAKKHFKGTIDFKRGCKKAEGSENEFCMLLSDSAKSISLPMLLCDEEDVVGNHSTASGKINNKELFYLMSRGLTMSEAKILLIRAKFNIVIEKITNEKIREEILQVIDNKLLK